MENAAFFPKNVKKSLKTNCLTQAYKKSHNKWTLYIKIKVICLYKSHNKFMLYDLFFHKFGWNILNWEISTIRSKMPFFIKKAPPSPTGGILLAEKIFTSAKKSTSYEKKTNWTHKLKSFVDILFYTYIVVKIVKYIKCLFFLKCSSYSYLYSIYICYSCDECEFRSAFWKSLRRHKKYEHKGFP